VQLVRNLEHSRRFLQPRLSGEASQAKEGNAQRPGQFRQPQFNVPTAPPGVEFDILANYNPLPEGESYAKPSTAKHATPSTAKHTTARAAAVRGAGR
jgi:type IV pilus assembly protein PilN